MNELLNIKINESNEQIVDGRELHQFLRIDTRYNDWFARMIGYGFIEGKDFYSNLSKTSSGGRPSVDHTLKLSMAKELCMLARNERGKRAREYFIRCEEAWNKPEAVMARALVLAGKQLKSINEENSRLMLENQMMKPKAEYFDELVDRKSNTNIRITAKLLKIPERKFVNRLLEKKFLYRDKRGQLQPCSIYTQCPKPYFEVKESKGDNWVGTQTLITPYGREAFRLLFA